MKKVTILLPKLKLQVLKIALPKKEEAKPKQVEIKIEK